MQCRDKFMIESDKTHRDKSQLFTFSTLVVLCLLLGTRRVDMWCKQRLHPTLFSENVVLLIYWYQDIDNDWKWNVFQPLHWWRKFLSNSSVSLALQPSLVLEFWANKNEAEAVTRVHDRFLFQTGQWNHLFLLNSTKQLWKENRFMIFGSCGQK